MPHKLVEMEDKAEEEFPIFFSLLAGGKIWDDTLGKKVLFCELIKYTDSKICVQWLRLGGNEFGRLFRGFLQNGEIANSIGVLDLI